jgi:hypothetical protein
MKILLGDFNAKVGREDIFKPAIGNESLHEISNDNGVRGYISNDPTERKSLILGVPICILHNLIAPLWKEEIRMIKTHSWRNRP